MHPVAIMLLSPTSSTKSTQWDSYYVTSPDLCILNNYILYYIVKYITIAGLRPRVMIFNKPKTIIEMIHYEREYIDKHNNIPGTTSQIKLDSKVI